MRDRIVPESGFQSDGPVFDVKSPIIEFAQTFIHPSIHSLLASR